MRTLYLDCQTGAAGDMLTAALLSLHPQPDEFLRELNGIGIPNVKTELEAVKKHGLNAYHVRVSVNGEEEEHHHEGHHEHHEHHHEHHHHAQMTDIRAVISALKVSDKIKADIENVYNIIAEAESEAHGETVEMVHFHEVGAMDAVADVAAVCMLIDALKPDKVIASPVGVGGGTVRCAHGVLPVPAPATANILRGLPVIFGGADGELCTPTGAALIKYFADEFTDKAPILRAKKIGCGVGSRDFKTSTGGEFVSVTRAFLCESEESDSVTVFECTIDDMTGEETGFAVERLMEKGALDAYTAPIYMKKNRPGILLTVICRGEDADETARLIFKHTTTIGIRERQSARRVLERTTDTVQTPYGEVRVKKSAGYGVSRTKAEYEDVSRIAVENDISLRDVIRDLD